MLHRYTMQYIQFQRQICPGGQLKLETSVDCMVYSENDIVSQLLKIVLVITASDITTPIVSIKTQYWFYLFYLLVILY